MKNMIGKLCLIAAASGICPAWGGVDGVWSATGLARIDIAVINGKGVESETTMAISTGDYQFNAGGDFAAGDIRGSWKETWNKYVISPDYASLAETYARSLESKGIIVNDVRVLSSRMSGAHYGNGILGNEAHRYRIDIGSGAGRLVMKVSMNVEIGAYEPQAETSLRGIAPTDNLPARSVEDLAAEAVLQKMRALGFPASSGVGMN
jgi:hypothetical protein